MTTNRELFSKHAHLGFFIETGTCYGRSVVIALSLGFKDIRSVEATVQRMHHCAMMFRNEPRVRLWEGESPAKLPEMIQDIKEPALFWLDAHPSGAESYGQDFETNPAHHQSNILVSELNIIAERSVKGDVILIDDLTPDIEAFAYNMFRDAAIHVHDTDEGPHKVMEIVT